MQTPQKIMTRIRSLCSPRSRRLAVLLQPSMPWSDCFSIIVMCGTQSNGVEGVGARAHADADALDDNDGDVVAVQRKKQKTGGASAAKCALTLEFVGVGLRV